MDIFTSFATDDNAELNGVWQKGTGDAEFLIARAENRNYQRAMAKAIEQNAELLESKTKESDEKSEEILAGVYADTILLGWRGGVEYKKAPFPYTRENAVTFLKHKEFRKWVARKASDLDQYRAKLETEQGNV